MSIEFYKCLYCAKFFHTLNKIEEHVKEHDGNNITFRRHSENGRHDFYKKLAIKDCFIRLVRVSPKIKPSFPDLSIVKLEEPDYSENPSVPIPINVDIIKQELNEDIKPEITHGLNQPLSLTDWNKLKCKKGETLCRLCNKKYASYLSLKAHQDRYHDPKKNPTPDLPSQCKTCEKYFPKNEINDHRILCLSNPNPNNYDFICKVCKKGFDTKRNLTYHETLVHIERKHECEICHLKFKKKLRLKEHQAEVHEGQRFHCEVKGCGKVYRRRRYILAHQRQDHNDIKPNVQQPKKEKAKEWKYSKIVVSGQQIFKCNACGEHLKSRGTFQGHFRAKHAPKIFGCEKCDKSFATVGDLSKHSKRNHKKFISKSKKIKTEVNFEIDLSD